MYKFVFIMSILVLLICVNGCAALMFEMPLGANKDNPRKLTYKLEKFYCSLGDDVCKRFRKFFRIDKGDSKKSAA